MEKEEVLKLEYTKINDDYTIATIVHQNEDILKRSHFNDTELKVHYRNKWKLRTYYKW